MIIKKNKMKKILLIIVLLNCFTTIKAQSNVDAVLPVSSPFQLGGNVEGVIQNSINKSSGKVLFSIPITSITANNLGHSVSLSYNGASVFETVKNTNEFNPTGILGVGFNFSVPKIIADYKNTAARDDDTFYLLDGNNTKLICTAKTQEYLEFQPEKYAPWKIKYHLGHYETIFTETYPGNWINVTSFHKDDYWSVIKEDGTIYLFGAVPADGVLKTNAKSYISTWGNWIGDSNQNPTGNMVTEWYLYKIKDQWDNYIHFKYEKVEGKQNSSQINYKHTEAMYLNEIQSSDNSKVTFTYGDKIPQEYYEPHTEQAEPDAYQEKYKKKYLQNIQTFNSNNQLVFKYKLEYDLIDYVDPLKPFKGKRFLRKLIQENKNGESLPAQEFEYHYSGGFKGGVNKITYPTGGSVIYNYEKKTLFNNNANRFNGSQPNLTGYEAIPSASFNAGDYVLDLYKTTNPISSNLYRYKIVRYHWTGSNWALNEFVFPHLLAYDYGALNWRLDGFKAVHGADFYGFTYHNRSTQSSNLYLFHLNKDGKSWNTFSQYISSVESKNESPYVEDPVLLNGDNFVAIGTKRTGELRIYNWNDTSWTSKYINQGSGEYYYSARNNFILSLNEDGGPDISNNLTYADNYYMHFLDSEKKWQTNSWTYRALQSINTIEEASYFYPSNSMTAFVADDNPEYFLRWDTNYNLTNIDNVLGGYDDRYPIYNVAGEMFAVDDTYRQNFRQGSLHKLARFNGVNWNILSLNNNTKTRGYSKDLMLHNQTNISSYSLHNPNDGNWYSNSMPYADVISVTDYSPRTSIFGKFLFLDKYLYKLNENPFSGPTLSAFNFLESMPFSVDFSISNGFDKAYVSSAELYLAPGFINSIKTRLYYINKTNGNASYISFDDKFGMKGLHEFGGYLKFLNGNSIYLRNKGTFSPVVNTNISTYMYHLIDEKVDQDVYDIVVGNIQINNQIDALRQIDYQFDDYTFLPNESTNYGKTTTEHKGFGSSNNGKIIDFFNTGTSDIRLIGAPIKTEIRDANNVLKSETIFSSSIFNKTFNNSSNLPVGEGYYFRTTQKNEIVYVDNGTLSSVENYDYNTLGLLKSKSVTNSDGLTKTITTSYANEYFPFLNAKNIINQPSKIIEKVTICTGGIGGSCNDKIIGTSETKWKEENNKSYPYQTLAGVETTKVLTEITKVNNFGLAEEESNGKGFFNVNLLGYNHKNLVAEIKNVSYNEVITQLEVSYASLQLLSTTALKIELLKLYTKLPKAGITLSFYDNNGNLISKIDSRKEEINYFYDNFNRLIYVEDSLGNRLTETEYKFRQ